MKSYMKLLVILVPVAVLAGCASPKVAQKPAPVEDRAGSATATPETTPSASGTTGVEVLAAPEKGNLTGEAIVDPLKNATGLLASKVIYFKYDSSEVLDNGQAIIDAHAANLIKNPRLSVTLEGHADERGSREYNLALGENRAKAVQQLMQLKGVSAKQIEVVSFGEERPAEMGHEDTAWAKNRRVELVYK